MHLIRPFRRLILVIVGVAVAASTAVIASLGIEHHLATSLPLPSGNFAVGRRIVVWRDSTADPFTPAPGANRELLVWIWYPAVRSAAPTAAPYLPTYLRPGVERDRGWLIKSLLTRDLGRVETHCLAAPPLADDSPSYPVVLLRGGASAGVWNYTTLAEDLASQGYIVVGFDAPYRTNEVAFPDGRLFRRLPQNNPENFASNPQDPTLEKLLAGWVADLRFALDRLETLNTSDPTFKARLDLAHVGVMGHSFGGSQAAELCTADSRCKAVVDLDGLLLGNAVTHGVHCPFLVILSDHREEADPNKNRILSDLKSAFAQSPSDARAWIEIHGGNHFLFSDDAALLKSRMLMRVLRTIGLVGIDGPQQLKITAFCVRSFFDAELKHGSLNTLRSAPRSFPEVSVRFQ